MKHTKMEHRETKEKGMENRCVSCGIPTNARYVGTEVVLCFSCYKNRSYIKKLINYGCNKGIEDVRNNWKCGNCNKLASCGYFDNIQCSSYFDYEPVFGCIEFEPKEGK